MRTSLQYSQLVSEEPRRVRGEILKNKLIKPVDRGSEIKGSKKVKHENNSTHTTTWLTSQKSNTPSVLAITFAG